jgi:hypothetical protein
MWREELRDAEGWLDGGRLSHVAADLGWWRRRMTVVGKGEEEETMVAGCLRA